MKIIGLKPFNKNSIKVFKVLDPKNKIAVLNVWVTVLPIPVYIDAHLFSKVFISANCRFQTNRRQMKTLLTRVSKGMRQ